MYTSMILKEKLVFLYTKINWILLFLVDNYTTETDVIKYYLLLNYTAMELSIPKNVAYVYIYIYIYTYFSLLHFPSLDYFKKVHIYIYIYIYISEDNRNIYKPSFYST